MKNRKMGYHVQKLQHPTKTTISKLRSSITSFNSPFSSSSSSSSPPIQNQSPPNSLPISQSPILTPSELTKINNLIPRLIYSNQLPTALHLTKTALSSNPPLHSLNLTPLIATLTSQQHLTHTISLLTHLLHTPHSHSHISPISHMLLSSYIDNRTTNHAFKLFRWLQRPGSPSPPDDDMFRLLIPALCRDGFVLQAIGAFRDMVGGAHTEFSSCVYCGQSLYRGLLSEARVNQAMELNAALLILARDTHEKESVLHVLDNIIADWME